MRRHSAGARSVAALSLLLLWLPDAYSTGGAGKKAGVSKKSAARRRRPLGHTGKCCVEPCTLIGPPAACMGLSTRAKCESAHTTAPLGSGRELCAWLGGRCNAATASDCPEAAEEDDASAVDYYGERAGFAASCGNGPSSTCPGLAGALERYAKAHQAATRHRSPPGGIHSARLLVIRDHWRNVGMGFMPSHVATVVLFALSAGFYVYVENYGRYDWTRYFHGHAGLDMRWTAAKHKMWRARFAAAGVPRTLVEVWHEDGSRRYAAAREFAVSLFSLAHT